MIDLVVGYGQTEITSAQHRCCKRTLSRTKLVFALVLLGGLSEGVGVSQAPCTPQQLTDTIGFSGNGDPVIDSHGGTIAFTSFGDFVPGSNMDGNQEIFLLDVAGGEFIQVTDTVLGSNSLPSLSYDGSRIAFGSLFSGDISALLWDASTSSISQIVPKGGGSIAPGISGDGRRVSFVSSLDLVPGRNSDRNFELFVYDIPDATFAQITDTTGSFDIANLATATNEDGTRVAFLSQADYVPGSNSDNNEEFFLADTITMQFTQVTDTTGPPSGLRHLFSLDRTGTVLAFASSAELVPGGNPEGNREIYLFDATSGDLEQITAIPFGAAVAPVISHDARRVAFVSNFDFVPGAGQLRIFLYDVDTASFHHVAPPSGTQGGGFGLPLAINGDGTRIVFTTNGDLVPGANADGNSEIFLATCTLALPVTIDIKPGSDRNSVNPRAGGVIPVAVLTTSSADGEIIDFDATEIDLSSLEFGPGGASIAHDMGHVEDVDYDGDLDLMLHFRTSESGIACGDTSAMLTGQTFDGQAMEGSDLVRTVGCK